MKVLIVDDEPIARSSLKALFESANIDVYCAGDGAEALQLAGQYPPDAAVIDWMLRDETDGLELASQLRGLTPHTRLILTTGYPLEGLERRRRDCDFDFEVLAKPFSFEALLALIRRGQ